ncbi:hypothetical protein BKB99_02420 [Chlamydia trachomatis]|nr:hypothetical protein CTLINITIAL_04925 [Chlamydia trachomatis L2/434/Bu(i)]AGO32828.1 hypothetical protein CTLFINAL_04925 [Chlamydia trachomatis L2/434/Bu(f)]AGT70439.1 hypothetical protein O177_02455 [Chlamydia trachomatis]AHC17758.1 hypothetical protein CTW3_02480 [Chlamydia trachomatis C/TW-3]AKR33069.1 hypothetical protein DCS63711_02465 [Chlamydia trachomatis D/CS637/11]
MPNNPDLLESFESKNRDLRYLLLMNNKSVRPFYQTKLLNRNHQNKTSNIKIFILLMLKIDF